MNLALWYPPFHHYRGPVALLEMSEDIFQLVMFENNHITQAGAPVDQYPTLRIHLILQQVAVPEVFCCQPEPVPPVNMVSAPGKAHQP